MGKLFYSSKLFLALFFLLTNCKPNVERNFLDQWSFYQTLTNLLRPDVRFTFSYPKSSYTFTTGIPISPIFPITNRVLESCSVNPPLPAGISLGKSCEIVGTPTEVKPPINYQIAGYSEGLRSSFSVSIAVTSQAPSGLTYSGGPYVYTVGVSISPLVPTVSGTITNCSSSPSLPSGLSLDSDCKITGAPTYIQAFTSYTITASNPYGSTSTTIYITVNANPPSGLSYPNSSYIFTEGLPITPIIPTYTGSLTGCAVVPSLPSGIVLTLPHCAISGTPVGTNPSTNYTITGSNPYGSTSTTVNITVNIAPPSALTYTPTAFTFTQGLTITPITPTYSGTVTSCTTTPSLPPGLSIHGTTCQITGTPTTIQGATNYIVTASNSSGSTTANLTITINVAPPSSLTYTPTAFTFTQGLTITPITPTYSGTVTSCSASPPLPTGLSISNTTCAISGTPTALQSATNHTITASNGSGSTTATINITVNLAPPTISYTGSPFSFTKDVAISPIVPSLTGTVTSCTSSPTLPVGLSINNTTCVISGTPTTLQSSTTYTITATNGSGSDTASIAISVVLDPPSNLVYAGDPFVLLKDIPVTLTPTYDGTVTSCTVTPALPTGLSLNTSNCVISGTPTTNQTAANYTVTASNAYGSTNKTISIAIEHAGKLYFALFNSSNPRASRYGNAKTLSGSSFVNMGTTGMNYAVALDVTRDILYVGAGGVGGNTVFAFDNASTNTGTHNRTFIQDDMLRPVAFAVDETYDVLYVLSNDGYDTSSKRNIFVINNASTSHYTSSATLGPSFRKILTGGVLDSGTQGIRRMALVGNSLYINQYDNMKVFVFDNMHTYVNGQTATVSRTINLSGKPAGIAIDTVNDLMFVSIYNLNQIHVYSNASTINGTVSPIRTMSGPSISGPCGMRFIPSLNRLYVTNYTPETLIVIANATTANGTITPLYTLSGIPTVSDVAVDLTR